MDHRTRMLPSFRGTSDCHRIGRSGIGLSVSLGVVLIAAMGCNSHAYWAEAQQYHAAACDVLVGRGICSDEQDCQRKEVLFAEGGEISLGVIRWGGVHITLYQVQDEKVVEDISAKFKEVHARLGKPAVTLSVYKSGHLESKVKLAEVVIR